MHRLDDELNEFFVGTWAHARCSRVRRNVAHCALLLDQKGLIDVHLKLAKLSIRLLRTYDLSPWFFTNVIVIDEKAVPHSHPVLTLYTRHGRDDEHNLIPPSGSR